jgi:hypothetical protein
MRLNRSRSERVPCRSGSAKPHGFGFSGAPEFGRKRGLWRGAEAEKTGRFLKKAL